MGTRPCYMLITGLEVCMKGFNKSLQAHMSEFSLSENKEYYAVPCISEVRAMDIRDVYFQANDTLAEAKTDPEGKNSVKSRNLEPHEHPETLFDGNIQTPAVVYDYKKIRGLSKEYNRWWLSFYIPLDTYDGQDTACEWSARSYLLSGRGTWNLSDHSLYTVSVKQISSYSDGKVDMGNAFCVRISGIPDRDAASDVSMVILDIRRRDMQRTGTPKWLTDFDGSGKSSYYLKTEGLQQFYEIIFSRQEKEENSEPYEIYMQLPIIFMNLKAEY